MIRATPLVWISGGLVSLTMGIMLAGDALVGLVPNHDRQVVEHRRQLAESLAVQYSALTEHGQLETVKFAMEVLTVRTPDILSLALIQDGPGERAVLAQVGDHDRVWVQPPGDESTIEFFQIPIFSGSQKWGVLQIAFRPTVPVSIWEWLLNNPWMRFLAFVGVAGFLAYFYFMKRTLRQLDPSGIVPTRVKAALDALAQGVVMIDDQEFIVLANEAFSSAVGKSVESLMGANLGSLLWKSSVSSGL